MPALADPITLATLPVFRGLTREQLAWFNARLHRQAYPANATIFTVEQPAEVVYIILSGTVRIHVEQATGTDVIIDIGGTGDILGEMALIEGVGRSASANTLEESVLLWLDRASFMEALRSMPDFTLNLMRILSGRLRLANERIQGFAALDAYGRVARTLLAYSHRYGQRLPGGAMVIPIRLTQSDIAEMVGASRERVNQIMSYYKQRGYLSVDRNYRIAIHDPEALAKHSE